MTDQPYHFQYSLRRDYVLWVLVCGLIGLTAIAPGKIASYPQLVDWPTIQTLLGLLILTTSIELCGGLLKVAGRIATHIHNERILALFLTALSVVLAMVLTNDIALFVVVPLTLNLGRIMVLPLRRLVIFEALAVNCGSLLTPIGNPQNIFLWQHSGVSLIAFIWNMLPLFLFCAVALASFTFAAFRPVPLDMHASQPSTQLDRRLLLIAVLLYLPFLVLADMHYTALALALVAVVFLISAPRLLCRIDWPLMVVFVLMFIDLRLLAQQPWIQHTVSFLNLHQPSGLFASGALLSQAISNVPASILLAGYSADWRALAWGVNVGGYGLVIGSLANIIALRVGHQRGSLLAFHAWSIPFFLISGAMAFFWLWLH